VEPRSGRKAEGNWTALYISRLPRVGSRLSLDQAEHARAHGISVLKTSGTPRLPPPAAVLEAASRAVRENGTAPSQGLIELREAISEKLRRDNGILADPATQILVTNGAQHGLFLALVGALGPGDEVLVPTPSYFVDGLIALSAGKAVFAPLEAATGYALDIDRLNGAITPRTKAMMLVNPGNPGGHVATEEELTALAELVITRDLLLIADESYERITYDGRRHHSVGAFERLAGRVVTIHSCSKTYALAGWRVGYVAGPPSFIAQLRKVLEWVELGCDYISQKAAAAALSGPQDWTGAILVSFQRNRDHLVTELGAASGLPFVVPQGNPNLFLDIRGSRRSATGVAEYLLERHGIRTTPGEYFQTPGHVRLEFGGEFDVITEVGRRLRRATEELLAQNAGESCVPTVVPTEPRPY